MTTKTATPLLWGLLIVLSGNMLIDALEVSAAIVALPSIGADLGLPLSTLQWVVSGFALGFGGLLLFAGRVVALLGRRRGYLGALLVFAAASLLGGLAVDGETLIATRFVKGFCVALTAPTGLFIIVTTFPEGPARTRALSVYSLFGASGFSAGLLLSGLLTEIGWRWTFWFPAPVALVLFLFAFRLIPRDEPVSTIGRYDVAGAVTFFAAAVSLVYAVVSWNHPVPFVVAAVLLAAFVLVERAAERPLLGTAVLADPSLVRSALGAAALNGSYWGFLLIATFDLQVSRGWTPLETGLVLLPASLPLALSVLFSERMMSRFGTARLIACGAACPPVGYALYLRAGTLLPAVVLAGIGFVLAFAALHVQATAGTPEAGRAMAGGFYQTSVQIGGALLVALVAVLLEAGRTPALVLVTAVGFLGFLVALWSRP